MASTRVDRWLWAVRLCSSRTQATAVCHAGHVRVNDRPAKPSTHVDVGDRVQARLYDRDRIVEVVRVIDQRVGAPVAVECYIDHTPPPPERDAFGVAVRDRGAGRPTKRDRRQMDRWRSG